MDGPVFPMSDYEALTYLRAALGPNYGGSTDGLALTQALAVEGVTVAGYFHPRPWATAAALISENTEYEVGGSLAARIDRKLSGLRTRQAQMDGLAGISSAVAAAGSVDAPNHGGPVDTVPGF